jgi:hypothetical protein
VISGICVFVKISSGEIDDFRFWLGLGELRQIFLRAEVTSLEIHEANQD